MVVWWSDGLLRRGGGKETKRDSKIVAFCANYSSNIDLVRPYMSCIYRYIIIIIITHILLLKNDVLLNLSSYSYNRF